MLYEKASAILNSYPRPRVRVTLKSGEVLETPRGMLAAVSPKVCIISTDGDIARSYRWELVENFEQIADTPVNRGTNG